MYYPKSQIKTNLYTNGGEFINNDTKQEYIGYYYKLSTGEYFTGRTPSDKPNSLLIYIKNIDTQLTDNESVLLYNTINVINSSNIIPQYIPEYPTNQNYTNGEFRRYFCKKTNELIYIEINKDTYNLLLNKDPQLLWQLYEPFYINWILVGDKETVAKINKNIVELIMFKQKYYQFNNYLQNNFLKFWKP